MPSKPLRKDRLDSRDQLLGRLIPTPKMRDPRFCFVLVRVVLYVFKGVHALNGHIDAHWIDRLPIHRERIYVRTRDAVLELKPASFHAVASRLPSYFQPTFATLMINKRRAKFLDLGRSVKRVGFRVADGPPDQAEVVDWIALSRERASQFVDD
jgi:hypothetical protein